MRCWFCHEESRGTCAVRGRGLCRDHARLKDELTLTKTDTSTGYSKNYDAYDTLKCAECRIERKAERPYC